MPPSFPPDLAIVFPMSDAGNLIPEQPLFLNAAFCQSRPNENTPHLSYPAFPFAATHHQPRPRCACRPWLSNDLEIRPLGRFLRELDSARHRACPGVRNRAGWNVSIMRLGRIRQCGLWHIYNHRGRAFRRRYCLLELDIRRFCGWNAVEFARHLDCRWTPGMDSKHRRDIGGGPVWRMRAALMRSLHVCACPRNGLSAFGWRSVSWSDQAV